MKVALMGRSLRGRFSGVVRYTDELVRALEPRLGRDLTVFVTRAPDGIADLDVGRVRAPFPTPNEYARAAWEQCLIPAAVARLRADVYHSPNYILPVALACPAVVTVHDVFYLDRSVHRLRSHLYLSALTAIAIAKARRVICVSAYTRDRLLHHYPRASTKVRVVSEGIDARFHPPGAAEVAGVRARLGLHAPYVLFVGTVEPRKNLDRLVRAFTSAALRGEHPHDLVIAGGAGWKDGPFRAALAASPLRDRVRVIGYVPEPDMPALYAGADLFVFPSLEEGFGLPPLEAMACGAPVITSCTSALPEVVGDAAELVDPLDEPALALAIDRLLGNPDARRRLAAAGRRRAALFSWDRVAEETLAVYREAAS